MKFVDEAVIRVEAGDGGNDILRDSLASVVILSDSPVVVSSCRGYIILNLHYAPAEVEIVIARLEVRIVLCHDEYGGYGVCYACLDRKSVV